MGLDSFEINLSTPKNLIKIKFPLDKWHKMCYNIIVPRGTQKSG